MTEEDTEDVLSSNLYSWQESKGEVRISWKGKVVTVLRKESAMKFLERISQTSDRDAQLIMAKATGNFKRGNERNPSRK